MRRLLAMRFTAAQRVLSLSAVRVESAIRAGVAFKQYRCPNTTRIAAAEGLSSVRKFHSGSAARITHSWVLRAEGEGPAPALKPQDGIGELAMAGEDSAPPPAEKKRKRSLKPKKSETPPLVIPPTGLKAELAGFNGDWPALPMDLATARDFIEEAAASPNAVLLIPDRDIGGLCAGTIVRLTLQLLGKPVGEIYVHFVEKGRSIIDEKSDIEKLCQKHKIGSIIVLEQGSRGNEALISHTPPAGISGPERKTLIIDHRFSTSFAPNAIFLTSQGNPPIAPTPLLAYALCATLHHDAPDATALLAIVGTLGDVSTDHSTLEMLRSPPVSLYLDTAAALKKHTATWINKLVSLLNVTRRTPLNEGNIATHAAWNLLQFDPQSPPTEWPTPKQIMSGTWGTQALKDTVTRLTTLQERSRVELEKWKRTPPRYSNDGRIAVIEIGSPWQIHGMLAPRWVRYLGASNLRDPSVPRLLGVVVANRDYVPERVNFSVRRTTYAQEKDVDMIELLKEYADEMQDKSKKAMGTDFARGTKEATWGSLEKNIWNEYKSEGMKLLDIGRGGGGGVVMGSGGGAGAGAGVKKAKTEGQKNTLDRYGLGKPKPAETAAAAAAAGKGVKTTPGSGTSAAAGKEMKTTPGSGTGTATGDGTTGVME